jgi:Tudor domain.
MSDDLNTFMCDVKPDAVSKVEVGGLYCLYEEDCWLRVQVEEKVDALGPDHFLCKLIDHGEESVHTIDELYPLYDVFRTLPAQVCFISYVGPQHQNICTYLPNMLKCILCSSSLPAASATDLSVFSRI